MTQMYAVTITATGYVTDADGNVINEETTLESTITVTEEQLREMFPNGTTPIDDDTPKDQE